MDFDALYQRCARDVFRFALFLSGRPEEADDITAETFVRAWASREPIRVGTVKAYLLMIARNLHRERFRKNARHVFMEDVTVPDHILIDPARGPEEDITTRRELARVVRAMQQLPEADRAALLMRAQDEMPYEEIAAALGISVGAAKVKVHRARLKLSEIRNAKEGT